MTTALRRRGSDGDRWRTCGLTLRSPRRSRLRPSVDGGGKSGGELGGGARLDRLVRRRRRYTTEGEQGGGDSRRARAKALWLYRVRRRPRAARRPRMAGRSRRRRLRRDSGAAEGGADGQAPPVGRSGRRARWAGARGRSWADGVLGRAARGGGGGVLVGRGWVGPERSAH